MKKQYYNNAYLYDANRFGIIKFEYLYDEFKDITIYYPNSEEDANAIIDFIIKNGLTVEKQTIVRGLNDFVVLTFSNGDKIKFYKEGDLND